MTTGVEPALAAEGIAVRYGRRRLLDAVSFAVPVGDRLRAARAQRLGQGPRPWRCLLGQQKPGEGRALLFGKDAWKCRREAMDHIGVLPEEPERPAGHDRTPALGLLPKGLRPLGRRGRGGPPLALRRASRHAVRPPVARGARSGDAVALPGPLSGGPGPRRPHPRSRRGGAQGVLRGAHRGAGRSRHHRFRHEPRPRGPRRPGRPGRGAARRPAPGSTSRSRRSRRASGACARPRRPGRRGALSRWWSRGATPGGTRRWSRTSRRSASRRSSPEGRRGRWRWRASPSRRSFSPCARGRAATHEGPLGDRDPRAARQATLLLGALALGAIPWVAPHLPGLQRFDIDEVRSAFMLLLGLSLPPALGLGLGASVVGEEVAGRRLGSTSPGPSARGPSGGARCW